jgi:hypothetical protein
MAPRAKYDLDLFRQLVLSGKTRAEIMAEMEIKSSPTFNSLKLKLMEIDRKYYSIKSADKRAVKKEFKATIGKRNTLTLSSKMLEGSRFSSGDSFLVIMKKNKIILSLIEE